MRKHIVRSNEIDSLTDVLERVWNKLLHLLLRGLTVAENERAGAACLVASLILALDDVEVRLLSCLSLRDHRQCRSRTRSPHEQIDPILDQQLARLRRRGLGIGLVIG